MGGYCYLHMSSPTPFTYFPIIMNVMYRSNFNHSDGGNNFICSSSLALHTINEERFAGLNFHGFHRFQEYCESFSMNLSTSL